jgi:hypothetical protein
MCLMLLAFTGAARGARTPDPVITNDVLYQLSYCGGPWGRSRHAASNALVISGMPVLGKAHDL